MSYEASRKVPGGKLVKVSFDLEDERLKDVNITGDFFVQPPESLKSLENSLEGHKINDELVSVLEGVDAGLIGFSRDDIVKTLKEALGDEE